MSEYEVTIDYEVYISYKEKVHSQNEEIQELKEQLKREQKLISENDRLIKLLNSYQEEILAVSEDREKFKKENSQMSCAYCGELCARDTEQLIEHVSKCEKHPLRKAINEIAKRDELLKIAFRYMDSVGYITNYDEYDFKEIKKWLEDYEEIK